MVTKLRVMFSCAVVAAVAVGFVPPARAGAPAFHRDVTVGAFVAARRGAPTRAATVTSLNWSGYAVTPAAHQAVTAVAATFVVPTVTRLTPGFAATWTGIGGYGTADLIQAGVEEQFAPGLGASYYAWYETLPDSETGITGCAGDPTCGVAPGQTVTVKIIQATPRTWTITIVDAGHWSYTTTVPYASSRSSAEWILEAPTIAVAQATLPLMSPTRFTHSTYAVAGGPPRTITTGRPDLVDMVGVGLFAEGLPGPLTDGGKSFDACAYANHCA